MIRYHFDLYPRDNPKNGARLVRFTKLQSAEYRGEANGTGAGNFSIRADTAEAQLIDPRGLQYVRVVEEDTVAVTETVVGGFFLDNGDFQLLDERGTRLLRFGGAGTLSYLARSVMAPHTYIHDVFTGQDPFDDTWRLYAQSTVYANGNYLGAMLWRVIYEAQHFRNTATYTHRHADGVEYTDSHDDDRLASAIPDLVMDFTQFLDSSGVAWDQSSGEFKAQTNENVLAIVQRLMQAGLYVEMDPDTFELRAWQADDHRRTRTGASWSSTVVRFQAPTDGTIATGNIASDAVRKISAFIKRSLLWVGGQDIYSKVTGTTDIPWEGGVYSDTQDTTALTQIGNVQIEARDDAGDVLRIVQLISDNPTGGRYKPFRTTGVLLDDLVTVHTGTNQFDHNEQNFPVAAITVRLQVGGDWKAIYELGASFAAAKSRQFQVTPVPSHNHPPNPRLTAATDEGAGANPRHGNESLAARGDHGHVPQLTSGLTPLARIVAEKSASNPTFNFSGMPVNIVKVGDRYWCVYTRQTGAESRDVRLAYATDRDGPWTDYSGNPILTVGSQAWELTNNNNSACIVELDGTFYLFYDSNDGSPTAGIGVATASAITGPYTKYASNPVLAPGSAGAWDSRRVQEPSAIYHDGQWIMAFMGETTAAALGASEKIGIATASSPFGPWTKSANNPVIDFGASGEFDDTGAADPQLFFDNGYWWIWYSGLSGASGGFPWTLGLAYANDLDGPWDRHADNPIVNVGTAGEFDDETAWRGAVWLEEGLFTATYAGMPVGTQNFTQAKGGNVRLVVTDAVVAHLDEVDPHTQYQRESEKSAANGYASLDASATVPIGELPVGTTSADVAAGDHAHVGGGTGSSEGHAHVIGEQHVGDGATTTFTLVNEPAPDEVAAYVAGSRTDVTVTIDQIIFEAAPANGAAIRIDYVPAEASS